MASIGAVVSIPLSFFKPQSKTWGHWDNMDRRIIQAVPNVTKPKIIHEKHETRTNADYHQCLREKTLK